jgi:hypothetical protein
MKVRYGDDRRPALQRKPTFRRGPLAYGQANRRARRAPSGLTECRQD